MTGKKDLTTGFAPTAPTETCIVYPSGGCWVTGRQLTTPNPDDPSAPTVVFTDASGAEIPPPDKYAECPPITDVQPVWVMNCPIPSDPADPSDPPISVVCEPSMSEVFGPTTAPVQFNSIAVINAKCCKVVVTTSAGSFTVMPGEGGITEDFDCAVTLLSIEVTGDCDPASVHTILTKRY